MIPLVDLGWQQREIADEVRRGMDEVIESTAFVLGPQVAEFERSFADFVGVGDAVVVLVAVVFEVDSLFLCVLAEQIGVTILVAGGDQLF